VRSNADKMFSNQSSPLPFLATTRQSESNTGLPKDNLLTHPQSTEILLHELYSASVSLPFPKWSEVCKLPYLDACVNEGLRLHPPFALPFERVVPPGGITVSDIYLPAGTVVGGNPYVINRNTAIFGEEVEEWRPERWLDRGVEAQRLLSQSMLTVSTLFRPTRCPSRFRRVCV
jgi:cytochrome P450